jgi:uncharacterized Fe-S cluster-containing radical SAM superfamily protein
MFVLCLYVVLSGVDRGLCDELITRRKESYRVSHKGYRRTSINFLTGKSSKHIKQLSSLYSYVFCSGI